MPHFCNLSLSTKRRGEGGEGLYADTTISFAITPSLLVVSGGGGQARGGDALNASGRMTSFSVEG